MSEKGAKRERRRRRQIVLTPEDRRVLWAALQSKRGAPLADEEKVRELRDVLRLREAFSAEARADVDASPVQYTISKRAADYATNVIAQSNAWVAAALPDVKDCLRRLEDGEDVDEAAAGDSIAGT
jgi:hypothetical protein